MKKTMLFVLSFLFLFSFASCEVRNENTAKRETEYENYVFEETKDTTDFVMITTEKGNIVLELYPDVAPITVMNFRNLVKDGFYDGLSFHRIVKGFVIQGGDPNGNGTGGSGKTIKGEFSANGVKNDLSHTRGVISMARKGKDMNSATSQFFIVLSDNYVSSLDGLYAGFGMVIEGMDVVDALVKEGGTPRMNRVFFVRKVPSTEISGTVPIADETSAS